MFIGAIAGIVLALGVFGAVAWQRLDQSGSRFDASRFSPTPVASAPAASSVEKTSADADARPVYRYSVIPGGVRSPEELIEAMANDSAVASHYSAVDKAKLTSGRLNEPLKAHVSYRIGDRVYWTKRKVTLQAGEQIVTDGQTLVRGRCGNNVSLDPLLPTLDNEPKPEAFDSIVPASTLVQLDPAHSFLTPSDMKTPVSGGTGRAPFGNSSFGGGFAGPIPPGNAGTPGTQSDPPGTIDNVPPGGNPPGGNPPCESTAATISDDDGSPSANANCNSGNPPGGNPPGGDPPTDFTPRDVPNTPTPVPEPGTLLLVAGGAAVLLARRIRRHPRD